MRHKDPRHSAGLIVLSLHSGRRNLDRWNRLTTISKLPKWLDRTAVDMTLDRYSHVTSAMQRQAADALEAMIASAEQ